MNLDQLSLAELKDLSRKIERELQVRRVQDKERLRKHFLEQAEAAGFTVDEVLGKAPATKGSAKVKYRDPQNPDNTWAGRGRKPAWLVKALGAGASIEDFAL